MELIKGGMRKMEIQDIKNKIIQGDTLQVLKEMPDNTFDTIITSPPYWGLRDYGTATWEGGDKNCDHKIPEYEKDPKRRFSSHVSRFNKENCYKCGAKRIDLQIGLEKTLDEFIAKLLAITQELQRVLKPTGVMFWNMGDCYNSAGTKMSRNWDHKGKKDFRGKLKMSIEKSIPTKCLMLQNYRLILKMIDEQNWTLRNTIIWHKPNAMPSSVKDRFSSVYEPVYMLVKKKKYWFDLDAVRVAHKQISIDRANYERTRKTSKGVKSELYAGLPANKVKLGVGGKNPGDVWRIPTHGFPEAHFATFPEKLIIPMIKSSCPKEICKKCGKARIRISNTKKIHRTELPKDDPRYRPNKVKNTFEEYNKHGRGYGFTEHTTIGWTKCNCQPQEYEAGVVLDPFMGSGTVGVVAKKLGRNYCGIELNKDYIKIAEQRIRGQIRSMF